MKTLLLMRHAKSSWSSGHLTDKQRPLNSRGKQDAPLMAKRILDKGITPQTVYSSSSQRTRETYGLMQELFNSNVEFKDELYLADIPDLLDEIRKADPTKQCIMILAHNPGITEMMEFLCPVTIDNVPTAGVACIQFNCEWEDVNAQTGRLLYFDYPKNI